MKITKQRIKEIIREELLREASFKKLIIPNDTKTKKLVSNMIKKMKLKIDKDYDFNDMKFNAWFSESEFEWLVDELEFELSYHADNSENQELSKGGA